mgnify:FL=1
MAESQSPTPIPQVPEREVSGGSNRSYVNDGRSNLPSGKNLQSAMDANEFRVIAETLRTCRTRKEAASVLGISERTLRYKMARMKERGFEVPKRRSA